MNNCGGKQQRFHHEKCNQKAGSGHKIHLGGIAERENEKIRIFYRANADSALILGRSREMLRSTFEIKTEAVTKSARISYQSSVLLLGANFNLRLCAKAQRNLYTLVKEHKSDVLPNLLESSTLWFYVVLARKLHIVFCLHPVGGIFQRLFGEPSVLRKTLSATRLSIAAIVGWGALVFSSLAQANPYQDAVLADNPVHYYRFDEPSGTSAANIGSNGTAGTYGSSTGLGVATAGPNLGTAISLDGTATGTIAANVNLSSTGGGGHPATIEFWMNVASQTGNNTAWQAPAVVGNEAGGCCNDGRFGYLRADGTLAGSIGNDAGVNSTFDVTDNWHHFVFVRDAAGTTIDLYIDGVLDASAGGLNNQIVTNSWPTIGQQINGTTNAGRISGLLDEFAIYNTALTAAQIQTHFEAAFLQIPEPSSWLLFTVIGLVALLGARAYRRRDRA